MNNDVKVYLSYLTKNILHNSRLFTPHKNRTALFCRQKNSVKLTATTPQYAIPYLEWDSTRVKYTLLADLKPNSFATILISKHQENHFLFRNSLCFLNFKLLSKLMPRNSIVSLQVHSIITAIYIFLYWRIIE